VAQKLAHHAHCGEPLQYDFQMGGLHLPKGDEE